MTLKYFKQGVINIECTQFLVMKRAQIAMISHLIVVNSLYYYISLAVNQEIAVLKKEVLIRAKQKITDIISTDQLSLLDGPISNL